MTMLTQADPKRLVENSLIYSNGEAHYVYMYPPWMKKVDLARLDYVLQPGVLKLRRLPIINDHLYLDYRMGFVDRRVGVMIARLVVPGFEPNYYRFEVVTVSPHNKYNEYEGVRILAKRFYTHLENTMYMINALEKYCLSTLYTLTAVAIVAPAVHPDVYKCARFIYDQIRRDLWETKTKLDALEATAKTKKVKTKAKATTKD